MQISKALTSYIDAGFPIIYINSFEKTKMDGIISSVMGGRKGLEWNGTQGFCDFKNKSTMIQDSDLPSTLKLLSSEDELDRKFLVIKDAHLYFEDPTVISCLKTIALKIAQSPAKVFLYGEKFEIPLAKKNIKYIGINHPTVTLEKSKFDYEKQGIYFQDITIVGSNLSYGEELFLQGKYQEAFPVVKEEANNGNPRAMYIMVSHYQQYDVGDIDEQTRNDEPLLMHEYAMYLGGKELYQICTRIFEDIKYLAETGDILAQYKLCSMYRYGQGVEQNKAKAVEWCRKAAEQGYGDAQYNLVLAECIIQAKASNRIMKKQSNGTEKLRNRDTELQSNILVICIHTVTASSKTLPKPPNGTEKLGHIYGFLMINVQEALKQLGYKLSEDFVKNCNCFSIQRFLPFAKHHCRFGSRGQKNHGRKIQKGVFRL